MGRERQVHLRPQHRGRLSRDAVARQAVAEQECTFCGAHPAGAFDVLLEAFMVGVNNTFERQTNAAALGRRVPMAYLGAL